MFRFDVEVTRERLFAEFVPSISVAKVVIISLTYTAVAIAVLHIEMRY